MVAWSRASTGCISIPPGWQSLTPCEYQVIAVDELAELGQPDCDLTGSTLTFGSNLSDQTISGIGASFASESPAGELCINNWGVPGVGAALVSVDGRVVSVWASTDEARDLQQQQLRITGVTDLG